MKTAIFLACCAAFAMFGFGGQPGTSRPAADGERPLPPPKLTGRLSLEEAIAARRSVREFSKQPLTVEELGQLCWAGQGITDPKTGHRAAPSAGAKFPIELFLVTAEGLDHYLPKGHRLERLSSTDLRSRIQEAALGQECVGEAAVCVVIAAVEERVASKYGRRAHQYCLLEAGHVAQNMLLQAVSLQLGGVAIGAYDDDKVAKIVDLPKDHRVLYMLAIGRPRE